MKKKAVIILSGGMDSGVLLADYLSKVDIIVALFFDYGSKHNSVEQKYAKNLAKQYNVPFKVVNLPFFSELFNSSLLNTSDELIPEGHYQSETMKSTVVPFRNGIMLSIAIGYAENSDADLVLIGSHSGDHAIYPDCRKEFNLSISQTAELGTYNKIKVISPYQEITKFQIAQIGRKLKFNFEKTWSCYKGGNLHCGKCGTCVERKEALAYHKGLDPTKYLPEA